MRGLLEELSRSKGFLVAGSYACGEQTENSDIDFYIKIPKECKLYGGENPNIVFLKNLLSRFEIPWNSTRTGYISTIGEKKYYLPIDMEFYEYFHPNKNKKRSVEIMGVEFKTR